MRLTGIPSMPALSKSSATVNSDADLGSLQEIAYSEENQRHSYEDYQMIVVKAKFGEIKCDV